MGDLYDEINNYQSYLNAGLSQASTNEQIGNDYLSQIQDYKQGRIQQKTMGDELTLSTGPLAFGEGAKLFESGKKLYEGLQKIKAGASALSDKFSSVVENPDALTSGLLESGKQLLADRLGISLDKVPTDLEGAKAMLTNKIKGELARQTGVKLEDLPSNLEDAKKFAYDKARGELARQTGLNK